MRSLTTQLPHDELSELKRSAFALGLKQILERTWKAIVRFTEKSRTLEINQYARKTPYDYVTREGLLR